MFKTFKTFESGLSDLHKLVLFIMKSGSFRGPKKKDIQILQKLCFLMF